MAIKQKTQKKQSVDSKKKKGVDKKYLISIPIIILIALLIVYMLTSAMPSVSAQLIVETGTVQVKSNGGSWIIAEDGMELYESDSVRTTKNATASVILFKNCIVRLDSNTEITIRELIQDAEETSVSIDQDVGRTWNTVQKISGIDNYEVQTPTAVASVRGTAFDVNHLQNGTTIVGVGTGQVNVTSRINITGNKSLDVKKNESVIIDPNKKNLSKQPFKKDEWVKKNEEKDKNLTALTKAAIYEKINPYIPELKDRYGVTDEELDVLIDGYLEGEYDIPPETPNWIRDLIENP